MEPFDAVKYERLMNGLEAVEMSFIEVFNPFNKGRIDPEFFGKGFKNLEDKLKVKSWKYLSEISFITDGEHGIIETNNVGFAKYFGARNVLNGIVDETSGEFISKTDQERLIKSKLRANDVLISCVGTIGYAAIVPSDIGEANIVRNVSLIRSITDDVLNSYLLCYFLSKFGKRLFVKMNTGNVQPLVSLDYIKNIPTFIPSRTIQSEIDRLVLEAVDKRRLSKAGYNKAVTLLLDELGLHNWQPTKANTEVKSFKSSFLQSGRLDAEYYQPKFDELVEKLEATGRSISLGELLTYNQRGTQPVYTETEEGLPVLNSKHIRKNRIDFVDNRSAYREFANKNSIIKKGDVLINGTGVGTIGRTAPYLLDSESLPDNHVTILRSDSIDPVFLSVMLNSIIGSMQVDKFYKGSSGQIELYPNDIAEFIVWNAPTEIQQSIRNCIEEANRLEQQSQHLLSVAKQSVEIAIEQSEEAAIEFIKTQAE